MPAALPAQGALGQHIRDIRERLGMTTMAFAAFLGVSQAQVSNWELGKNKPGPRTAWRLHREHGLPLDVWFAADTDDAEHRSPKGCNGSPLCGQAVA